MAIASVIREGVKLSCRATGPTDSGRAVLLIHGLNANMAFWHPLVVRRLAADRLVLLCDQRGHGNSDRPASGYTLSELAEDARAILDAHNVTEADVIGHSFGSGVALKLAQDYPQRVRSVTVLDGRLRSLQGDVRLGDWAYFPRWVRHLETAGVTVDPNWKIDCALPMRLEGIDFSRVAKGLEADGFFVPRINNRAGVKYRRLMTETTAQEEYGQPSGLTRETLCHIGQPVLLLYGTMSPFLPTCEILAAELPEVQVEILEGAGHNFPLTQPTETLRALARWDALSLAVEQSGNYTYRGI